MDVPADFALSVATELLDVSCLGPSEAEAVAALCCAEASDGLAPTLASWLLPSLLEPPGAATSNFIGAKDELAARGVAELYWRCATNVCLMDLDTLRHLACHHSDLKLPPDDAPDLERRRALVLAVLPRFSMACTTREQAEDVARRRAEIAKLRREVAEEDRAAEERAAAKGGAAGDTDRLAAPGGVDAAIVGAPDVHQEGESDVGICV